MAYTIGPISGAHINPAVTMGFLVSRRMTLTEAVGYWIAEFVGAIAGALVLWGSCPGRRSTPAPAPGLGADGFGKQSSIGINAVGAFVTEVILTLLFVFVVLAATSKLARPGFAGLAIGLGLTVGPPHRHPHHGDVGQPGPQPGPGAHRRAMPPSARCGCSSWRRWSGGPSPPCCTGTSSPKRLRPSRRAVHPDGSAPT